MKKKQLTSWDAVLTRLNAWRRTNKVASLTIRPDNGKFKVEHEEPTDEL